MDQELIDVAVLPGIDLAHAVQTLLVGFLDAARRGEDLGRDKDGGAWEVRGRQGRADLRFVAVELRRVDVSVARGQGREARLFAGVGGGEVDAKAEAGDLGRGGVEGQRRGYA